jgi:hypothetical protein
MLNGSKPCGYGSSSMLAGCAASSPTQLVVRGSTFLTGNLIVLAPLNVVTMEFGNSTSFHALANFHRYNPMSGRPSPCMTAAPIFLSSYKLRELHANGILDKPCQTAPVK